MPRANAPSAQTAHESRGLLLGFIGVLIFSLTLPMTRVAVAQLDPWLIGFGRAVLAAIPAAMYLAWRRAPRPTRADWPPLAGVVIGVIVGFPVCSSIGMQTVPASHGAIVIGVLPLATAPAASSSSCLPGAPAAAGSSPVTCGCWRPSRWVRSAMQRAGGSLAGSAARKSSAGRWSSARRCCWSRSPGSPRDRRGPLTRRPCSPLVTSRCFPSCSGSSPGTAGWLRADWRALDRSSCCRCF